MGRWRLRLEVDEAGATRDPDAPTAWELYSINVVAQQQGSGVADDLMQATAGDRNLTLWVAAENARAQRFYDRHGFRIEGATRMQEVTGVLEMRMLRRHRAAER